MRRYGGLVLVASSAVAPVQADRCVPACGSMGHCQGSWNPLSPSYYCVCNDGYGPGNFGESCCAGSGCNSKGHGKCAGPNAKKQPGHCECDSDWSGPDCTSPPAASDPCHEVSCGHGVCIATGPQGSAQTHRCDCDPGWSLNKGNGLCNTDQCTTHQCGDHGTCEHNDDGVICNCHDGYTGPRCETAPPSTDPCKSGQWASGKCGAHGNCQENPQTGDPYCACEDGFTGANCNVDPCKGVPCLNGGTCIVKRKVGLCQCAGTGYTGEKCNKHACTKDCNAPHGECKMSPGGDGTSMSCNCLDDWTGDGCESAPAQNGPCNSNPCGTHGSCKTNTKGNANSTFGCDCIPGFSGPTCNIDACDSSAINCGIHGECDAGKCVCDDHYDGDSCQTNLCANTNCGVNGECVIKNIIGKKSAQCNCGAGYSGHDCSKGPCTGIDCNDHGGCFVVDLQPSCDCVVGFYAPSNNRTSCINGNSTVTGGGDCPQADADEDGDGQGWLFLMGCGQPAVLRAARCTC